MILSVPQMDHMRSLRSRISMKVHFADQGIVVLYSKNRKAH